jgi:Protein of unknown function (DUF2911)
MLRLIGCAAALAVLGSAVHAQQPKEPPPRTAPSSFATVEVHVNARPIGGEWMAEDAGYAGPARIAISYGQPHARGRKIVGGLIPNDTVWRFGANDATALHSDVDLTLGTLAVPRGDYTLYVVHAGGNWDLIVNSQTAIWGTDRNPAKDIGRVRLTARTLSDSEDALSIYLTPNVAGRGQQVEPSGVLRIKWGTVELSAPWKVKI